VSLAAAPAWCHLMRAMPRHQGMHEPPVEAAHRAKVLVGAHDLLADAPLVLSDSHPCAFNDGECALELGPVSPKRLHSEARLVLLCQPRQPEQHDSPGARATAEHELPEVLVAGKQD
jgi:hypothetical protein